MISTAITLFRLFFLAFCAFEGNVAVQYKSGGTTVDVSLEIIDENNSTRYCVDYLEGDEDGRDYKKACFSSLFTDGGKFRLCEVEFGDEKCVQCRPCTSSGEDGYDLDCYNIQPTENTNVCTVLNNENIQQVLVDMQFEGMNLLDFNMTEAVEQANGNQVRNERPPVSSAQAVGETFTGVLCVSIIGLALIW